MTRLIIYSLLAAAAGFGVGSAGYQRTSAGRLTSAPRDSAASGVDARNETHAGIPSKSEAEVLGLLFQAQSFRNLAELGAVLRRLDSRQIGALLDRLDRPGVENRGASMQRLIAYWARLDPAAATAWMQSRLALFQRDTLRFRQPLQLMADDEDTGLVRAWAQNAPELALEYARQHGSTHLAGIILTGVIDGPLLRTDAEKWELLSSFPDEPEGAIDYFFSKFATRAQADYATAETAALSLPPGSARNRAMERTLAHWKGGDPEAALARFRSLGVDFPALLPIVAHRVAQQNPERVAQWLDTLEPAEREQCQGRLVADWANKDPLKAFAWAQERGVSLTESARMDAKSENLEAWWSGSWGLQRTPKIPLEAAISAKPEATAEWLRKLEAGPERTRLIELALQNARDEPSFRSLISELPDEAAGRIITSMGAFRRSESEMQKWADEWPPGEARESAWQAVGRMTKAETVSLPSGPDRDALFGGVAQRFAKSPEQAWGYLQQVEDPVRRRQAFDDLICSLRPDQDFRIRDDEKNRLYRDWMESTQVPDEWKKPWRMYTPANN